jgi:hypothetical protein
MQRRTFLLTAAAAAAPVSIRGASAQPLFNGKDLSGWHIVDGPESAFYVQDGAICASPSSLWPAWLSTDRKFENFDLSLEFFVGGWSDGGVYFAAPLFGPPSSCGYKVNIFQQADEHPMPNSMGAIFPVVAPSKVNVKSKREWNTMRIRFDWPKLQVWTNGERIQDLDVRQHPELAHRLRQGTIGLEGLGYPLKFRNLQIEELPSTDRWTVLYNEPGDIEKHWMITDNSERAPVRFVGYGPVLWCDGSGNLGTKEMFADFELQLYIRGPQHHNSGVIFRSNGEASAIAGKYEIQVHNVPEAHYPTGSLYHYKRARYPQIADEKWYLFQMGAKGKDCWVRVNGETVLEYGDLKNLKPGRIELQAHQPGKWVEFRDIRVKPA